MSVNRHRMSPMRRRAVDRLLVRYLELPETDQPAFLADARRRYPRLSRWLDRLTDNCHSVTLLDESVRQLAGDAIRATADDVGPLTPGIQLGPWEIIEEVGQGGMGMVYRGRRADGAFEMDVAIKLIGQRRRGLADMLQRECRLLAKLDHPNITRLVDAGLDDSAGPFLVMEWIEGIDLQHWVKQRKPRANERLRLFEQLVEATAHAHQRLIIHGDIKPGNVRIRADGTVKLMDFGVARLLESDSTDGSGLSALTPSFAAPEQLQGEGITARSDTWALGALLFWLLTGSTPPRDPRLAAKTIRTARFRRRKELGALIDKACAVDPADRYQSATELAIELSHFNGNQPLAAVSPTTRYRLTKFAQRNPILLGGVTATVTVLLTGLVATSMLYQQAASERDRAEQHAAELAQVAAFQEAQLADIDIAMMGVNMRTTLLDMAREVTQGAGGAEIAVNRLGLVAETLSAVNFTDYARTTLDENVFERTRQAMDELFDGQPLVKARLLQTLATTLREIGLHDQAVEPQNSALSIRREQLGVDHPETLTSMMQLVHLQVVRGQYQRALETLEQRLALQLPTQGEHHPETLASINSIGSLHFYLGDLEKTRHYYRQALEGRLAVLGEHHGDTAFTMTGLGAALRESGDYGEAEDYLFRALDILTDVHGPSHHRTRNTMRQIASTFIEQGRLERAEQQLERLHAIERKALGNRHYETMHTLYHLGRVQQLMGKYDKGEDNLRKAVEGRREILGGRHPQTLDAIRRLASLLHDAGQQAEAERLFTLAGDPEHDREGRRSQLPDAVDVPDSREN